MFASPVEPRKSAVRCNKVYSWGPAHLIMRRLDLGEFSRLPEPGMRLAETVKILSLSHIQRFRGVERTRPTFRATNSLFNFKRGER